MKLYKHGFIGHDDASITIPWTDPASIRRYSELVIENSPEWHFIQTPCTYTYNSLGHRSKEIEEVDLDNYILTLGCSHTEGVGIEEEKRYTPLLANKLKCDYYNMGVGGTGMDVVVHNLVTWFAVIPKKPKLVVIQWPEFTRILTGTDSKHLQPRGLWNGNEDYKKFISLGIDLEYFEAKKILNDSLAKAVVKDIPLVYFGLQRIIPFNDDTIIRPMVDKARDMGHPGNKSNQLFADSIYDHLINTECLSFYQNPEEKS